MRHPYKPLQHYLACAGLRGCIDERVCDEVVRTATYAINDCYRTDVVLCYAPHVIALSGIHIATAVHKIFPHLPSLLHELLSAFNAEIGEVTAELLELYRQTSRLAENDELAPGASAKLNGHWRAARDLVKASEGKRKA